MVLRWRASYTGAPAKLIHETHRRLKCTTWGHFSRVASWLLRITWCSFTTCLFSREKLTVVFMNVVPRSTMNTNGETEDRPFPSSLVPLFQGESKCETILMKMTLICMKMKLHAELIFIWKVSHLDSLWNRGTRELGNGLLKLGIQIVSNYLFIFSYIHLDYSSSQK